MTLFALIYLAALLLTVAGLVSTSLALLKMSGDLSVRWRWIVAPLWLPVLFTLVCAALLGAMPMGFALVFTLAGVAIAVA